MAAADRQSIGPDGLEDGPAGSSPSQTPRSFLHRNTYREQDAPSPNFLNVPPNPNDQRQDSTGPQEYWSSASLRRLNTSQSQENDDDKLTVGCKSKVEEELADRLEKNKQGPPLAGIVGKWIVMVLLFLSFLACLVVSKLSIVQLGSNFYQLRNNSNLTLPKEQNARSSPSATAESLFFMILITLLIPYSLTLVRCVWCGGFRSDRAWPSPKAFLLGLISTGFESFGISLFTIEVLSESPNFMTVWVMNGVFFVPILFDLVRNIKDGPSRKKGIIIAMVIALILEVCGIILTVIFEITDNKIRHDVNEVWAIPVSLICMSFAWMPYLQKQQLLPTAKRLKELIDKKPVLKMRDPAGGQPPTTIPGYSLSVGTSGVGSSIPPDNDDHPPPSMATGTSAPSLLSDIGADLTSEEVERIVFTYPQFSARWKNGILQNTFKILFITGFCFAYSHVFHIIDMTKLSEGIQSIRVEHANFSHFMCSIFCSFGAYMLGWIACTICLQMQCFALPLTLATPICLVVIILQDLCILPQWTGNVSALKLGDMHLEFIIPAALCLLAAQILSTSLFIFKTQTIVMQLESHLFWQPGYNSVFLEQGLLLGRKNVQNNENPDPRAQAQMSRVFICTTMYRECANEMEQLLQSLRLVNIAKQESNRNFQSHIFFDNGVRDTRLTTFALQLVCLVKSTLGLGIENASKVQTPYGMRLSWELPRVLPNKSGMHLCIHFKDNKKVKNKKRWSQVMYMSYVIDFFIREEQSDQGVSEENTFILTTDADVKFNAESVEALLDLMSRDQHVGAVCSRTHPMGSGPLYWFQIFDYAIGHWLQKAANHVLGSVLCCPGCFSVYRVSALRDVLPTYATKVDKASEFLTKDMGEDRWLCTLLVQSGWRLEYCAAAENSTYCPEEFEEFFKQRRRWTPSTLANQWLLLQEWHIIRCFNKQISLFFLIYQAILLLSTMLNPSVCILIMVGGLYYAWGVNQALSTVFILLVVIIYTLVCLYCSQDTQILIAKLLTMVFALVMAAVFIGTAVQIVEENKTPPNITTTVPPPTTKPTTPTTKTPDEQDPILLRRLLADDVPLITQASYYIGNDPPTPPPTSVPLPMSVTSMYLLGLVIIFVLTAILHLPEFLCLLPGLLYLLCLPAASLVLMIYSLCNITDRSWGTREEKKISAMVEKDTWQEKLRKFFRIVCFCCKEKFDDPTEPGTGSDDTQSSGRYGAFGHDHVPEEDIMSEGDEPVAGPSTERTGQKSPAFLDSPRLKRKGVERSPSLVSQGVNFAQPGGQVKSLPVSKWLPKDIKDQYTAAFENQGYEDTTFIAGLNEDDLTKIGVKSLPHRQKLLAEIKDLPDYDVEPCVPDHVGKWLDNLGLGMYRPHFRASQIVTTRDLETLKAMNKDELKSDIGITKPGHLRRLLIGIQALRYPTQTERERNEVKYEVETLDLHQLTTINPEENDFWDKLRTQCLLPDSVAFAHDHDLKNKLTELRNSTLMGVYFMNALWIILISTLVTKSELNLFGTNALGLMFLILFGVVITVQFLTMLIHRCITWMHLIARAPLKRGQPSNISWSFRDQNFSRSVNADMTSDDQQANWFREQYNRLARQRYYESVGRRRMGQVQGMNRGVRGRGNRGNASEREPLLGHSHNSTSYNAAV